jgi:lipoyl(octanoyl) transferase
VSDLCVARLGTVRYPDALELQRRTRERRLAGEIPDSLLLVEHPPVYTKGRRAEPSDLPMGEDWYAAQGIEVCDADRGGRVTYHGPGQLVAYPIVRLGRGGLALDVPGYVSALERAMIAALSDEGIEADARAGLTGVWAGERKIGSIGVRVTRGVTMHGLAVNVDNDLQPFDYVVPCGIDHVRMTSVSQQTGRAGGLDCFRKRIAYRVAQALGLRQRVVTPGRLLGERPAAAPARVESVPA